MSIQQAASASYEEPEGAGEDIDGTWGDYPIDTMLIRTDSRTVHDVLRRIGQGTFVMNPDFQRDFIWAEDKQSKLIESVLMRIPLPVFYLAEDEQGRVIVVDGLQRLSTFQQFVNRGLRLKLPEQPDLDRKRFEDLSPKLQNRIEDCNLTLYMIDSKAPERARLDIFERVNSGVPLTRQQMRNSLFMGPATAFLRSAAASDLFQDATGHSLRSSTMRDREFVNRFCAFKILPLDEYRDMDEFLARSLREMNKMESNDMLRLDEMLRTGLNNNLQVFGRHAFRKHKSGQDYRSVINASLWDVMATGLSYYSEADVSAHSEELREAFYSLMDDQQFEEAITLGTNDVRRVTYRFSAAEEMLQEILGAGST